MENPESENRNVVELGLETWSNSLRRDWSFIFFLFNGQLKSTLNCQTCVKQSITFDNFTSIPLSLPEPSKLLINVIVYRLPRSLKELLSGIPLNKQRQSLSLEPLSEVKEDEKTGPNETDFKGAFESQTKS